jgi:hypothetical protein
MPGHATPPRGASAPTRPVEHPRSPGETTAAATAMACDPITAPKHPFGYAIDSPVILERPHSAPRWALHEKRARPKLNRSSEQPPSR